MTLPKRLKCLLAWGSWCIICLLPALPTAAQRAKIDSLLQVLRTHKAEDTTQANTLNELALAYRGTSADTMLIFARRAERLAKKLNFHRGLVVAQMSVGQVYKNKSDFAQALQIFLPLLRLAEQKRDGQLQSEVLYQIATVYLNQDKYDLALAYSKKILDVSTQIRYPKGIAFAHNGFATVYQKQQKYRKAIYHLEQALPIQRKLKNTLWISITLNNIGQGYLRLQLYEEAWVYLKEAEVLARKIEIGGLLSEILGGFAEIYLRRKDFPQALRYGREALAFAQKAGVRFKIRDSHKILYEICKEQPDFAAALLHHEAYESLKDSIRDVDLQNKTHQLQIEYEYDKRTSQLKAAHEQRDIAHRLELERQRNILLIFGAVAVLFLVVAVLVGIGYRQKQRANSLLAQQQAEITTTNEELKQQQEELVILNDNLNEQRNTIQQTYLQLKTTSEALQKSILYASKIQSAILPADREMRAFFQDYFALYKPKDVVSGDFYWFSQNGHCAVFVLADCTGHGVPGAFMSMLGAVILHETVNVKNLQEDPARILRNLDSALHKILRQAEGENEDGMDIAICCFEQETRVMTFAGARARIAYIHGDERHVLEGDRQLLGGNKMHFSDFTNQIVHLPASARLYLFSDGFGDQNNPKRKKIGTPKLLEMLFDTRQKNLQEQKTTLEELLERHSQNEPQRDDITVVGLLW